MFTCMQELTDVFFITRAMQDSQGVKSSWTHMEDGVGTEEGLSLGKTTPKWIGPELMQLAGSPSLWSKLDCAGEPSFR